MIPARTPYFAIDYAQALAARPTGCVIIVTRMDVIRQLIAYIRKMSLRRAPIGMDALASIARRAGRCAAGNLATAELAIGSSKTPSEELL